MNVQRIVANIVIPSVVILLAAFLRLIPHPANVAPIAAMAFFGGMRLDKKYALVVPLLSMFVSDLFLGFHDTMLFVYGSFIATGLLGMALKKYYSLRSVVLGALASSFLFFVVTNFGVFLAGKLYPHTLTGLRDTYIMALPFFRNTLIGDFIFTGLLFGGYEVAQRIINSYLKTQIAKRKITT